MVRSTFTSWFRRWKLTGRGSRNPPGVGGGGGIRAARGRRPATLSMTAAQDVVRTVLLLRMCSQPTLYNSNDIIRRGGGGTYFLLPVGFIVQGGLGRAFALQYRWHLDPQLAAIRAQRRHGLLSGCRGTRRASCLAGLWLMATTVALSLLVKAAAPMTASASARLVGLVRCLDASCAGMFFGCRA